jgi:integrase
VGEVIKIKTRLRSDHKDTSHFKFTPDRIEAVIKAGPGDAEYLNFFDTVTPGLGLRVCKNKASYFHGLKIAGAARRQPLGNPANMLLADARKAVIANNGRLALGETISAPREMRRAARAKLAADRTRNDFTLGRGFEQYLATRELKPRSIETYQDVWRNHMPQHLRTLPLADLDSATVEALHQRIGRKNKRSANKLIALLRGICNAFGRRFTNPTVEVRKYRESPRTRRLSPEEAARLKVQLILERDHSELQRAQSGVFVSVAYMTGARRGAIEAMKWRDLEFTAGQAVWIVPAHWSKNHRELPVALTGDAVAVLEKWRVRCPSMVWVFPSTSSSAGHITEPKKGWQRIRVAAGIGDVTLHDLRRSLGSEIAAAGGNAVVISAALGHLSTESAKAYLHLNVVEVRRTLENLKRHEKERPLLPDSTETQS